jgi:hypothetical protein
MGSTPQNPALVAAKITRKGDWTMKVRFPKQRTIFRWIHIILAIPILGYIYSPFDQIPNYAPATRFVFLPIMVLSGLWMWKGHVLQRLISKRLAWQEGSERT